MSDFILEYDILESIAKNSRSLGKRAEEYSQSLESKIIYAIGNVSGTSSGYLSSASDSVKDKINVLKQKSEAFYHFAEQVSNLLEVAERIDREVADAIAAQREYFLDHHESLRLSDWKAKLLNLLVDLKNSIPLLRTIADLLDGLDAFLESMDDSIRHWYECEGGKYILEAIGSVALAVVAIAAFVAAFPVSGFFAICGAIGAGIAAVNSVVNVATSFEAAGAAVNDNPAWAMIYGKQDKLSDVLRQTNFGNGTANNLSNLGAGGLDTVETFCDIVGFVGMGADALKFFKGDAFKLLKNKGSMDFSDLKSLEKNGIVDSKANIKQGYENLADDIKGLDKLDDINKGSGSYKDILGQRTKGLDLEAHPSNMKQLSAKKMSELKMKVDARTITKDEYAQYIWNQKISDARKDAVKNFWDMEIVRISEGNPTRPWSESQLAEIMSGKKPTFNGKALQGHHSYSVSQYPHLAGNHEVIWPATFNEHLNGWHGGNWRKSSPGKPIVEIDDLIGK